MKKFNLFVATGWLVFSLCGICFAQTEEWEEISREQREVSVILVNPGNSHQIYMAAKSTLWESSNGGKDWKNIFSEWRLTTQRVCPANRRHSGCSRRHARQGPEKAERKNRFARDKIVAPSIVSPPRRAWRACRS